MNIVKAKVGWNKDTEEDRRETGKFSANISVSGFYCSFIIFHSSGEEVPDAAGGKSDRAEAEMG